MSTHKHHWGWANDTGGATRVVFDDTSHLADVVCEIPDCDAKVPGVVYVKIIEKCRKHLSDGEETHVKHLQAMLDNYITSEGWV